MEKIRVYNDGEVVARVENSCKGNLDIWNGHNWCCGETGRHLGLVLLKKGKYAGNYVVIHSSNWVGERDSGRLIDDERALELILRWDNELLEGEDFARLKKLADEKGLL